jgi:type IV secretory pathway VirB9-like protein
MKSILLHRLNVVAPVLAPLIPVSRTLFPARAPMPPTTEETLMFVAGTFFGLLFTAAFSSSHPPLTLRRSTVVKAFCKALLCLLAMHTVASLRAADGARLVRYSQTDIVPIRAKVRFSTLIVLPADEEILDFTTGDKDYWIINGAHNLCYLHPAQAGVRSNFNLVTASGHVYSFLLSEISSQPNTEPDLKVFVVPADDPSASDSVRPTAYVRATEANAYKDELAQVEKQLADEIQREHAQEQAAVARYRSEYAGKLQFDYRYGSKAARAPFNVSAIYHDDKFTYIRCSAHEKPTIYEKKDNKPNLINFDFENGIYIIPKIVDEGYLAVGKKRLTFSRKGADPDAVESPSKRQIASARIMGVAGAKARRNDPGGPEVCSSPTSPGLARQQEGPATKPIQKGMSHA